MRTLEPFAYFTADTSGRLKVIGIATDTALPAGTIKIDGYAYHPDGSMYVYFS